MTTIPHEPSDVVPERRGWSFQLLVPEMWVALAIVVMWLAVLFDAVFGPDIVNRSAGGDSSSVPSAVAVALFAFLGTWALAKYALRRERRE
jgi:multisubunit Na+/H+ antiporter MnhF subunit